MAEEKRSIDNKVDERGNTSKAYSNNQKRLYIHYNPENYDGILLEEDEDIFIKDLLLRMDNAKTRMVNNLYNILVGNLDQDTKNAIELYTDRHGGRQPFVEMVAKQVQNRYATALSQGLDGWYKGMNQIYEGKNQKEKMRGFNEAMAALRDYAGIATRKGTDFQNLPVIQNLLSAINGPDTSAQAFANAIGAASEIPAMIAGLENRSKKIVEKAIQEQLMGAKGSDQKITITGRNATTPSSTAQIETVSKAADFSNKITLNFGSNNNEIGTLSGEITFDYFGSAKVSKNEDKATKLVQMGNTRFLTRFIEEFFGSSDAIREAYYNAMVLGSEKNERLDKNYRIIRAALMADLVDYYLTGSNIKQTQLMLVKNGRAYSMIAILEAIISKFSNGNFLVEGDDKKVGNYANGFTVKISGKAANAWIGEDGVKNRMKAYERTKYSRRLIDQITTRGEVNLEKILDKPSIAQGIPLP